jgi:hypothetical protein
MILIGSEMLLPINGCFPEASIAREVQLINKLGANFTTFLILSTTSP